MIPQLDTTYKQIVPTPSQELGSCISCCFFCHASIKVSSRRLASSGSMALLLVKAVPFCSKASTRMPSRCSHDFLKTSEPREGKSAKSMHGRLSAVWNDSTRNVCWMMEVSVKAAVTSQVAGVVGWCHSCDSCASALYIHLSSLLPIHHPVKLSKRSSKCHLGRWLPFHQATAAFSASFPKSSLLDMPS